MMSQFADMTSFSLPLYFLSLLLTGPDFISICSGSYDNFFYMGLTKNPEIGNTPDFILSNIWRLGWVRDNKFSMDVSNKMLLNAAKCQGHRLYRFWVIKWKPTGGE